MSAQVAALISSLAGGGGGGGGGSAPAFYGGLAYTGDGSASSRSYNAGVDLSGDDILLLTRDRTNSTDSGKTFYRLRDTVTANSSILSSAQSTSGIGDLAGSSTGWSLTAAGNPNESGVTYVGHVFRVGDGSLSIVTWTGNGATRSIPHGLGSAPGKVWIKLTNNTLDFTAWHRSLTGGTYYLTMSGSGATDAETSNSAVFTAAPDATNLYLGSNFRVNGGTFEYTAFVWAHDPTGRVQCGSYTGNGSASGPSVNLGWQPDFLVIKRFDASGERWWQVDTARTASFSGNDAEFDFGPAANSDNPEQTGNDRVSLITDGFEIVTSSSRYNANGGSYLFMAVRR